MGLEPFLSRQARRAYDFETGQRANSRDFDLGSVQYQLWSGMWSNGETMWIADFHADRIYAYDLESGERDPARGFPLVTARAGPGFGFPNGIWSDGVTMWVSEFWYRKIYAYNLADGARVHSNDFNTLGDEGVWYPTGIWSDGTTMWIVDSAGERVYAYNMPPNHAYDSPLNSTRASPRSSLGSLELTGVDIGVQGAGLRLHSARCHTVTSTAVTAVAAHNGSTVEILPADADLSTPDVHDVDLAVGDNTITVTVKSSDSTRQQTYTVTVTVIDHPSISDDATLGALSLSGIDIGALSAGKSRYSAYAASTVTSTVVSATPTDAYATVTITPADADTATADVHDFDLAVGANTITVDVESSDETRHRTYTVVVIKQPSAPDDDDEDEESATSLSTLMWGGATPARCAPTVRSCAGASSLPPRAVGTIGGRPGRLTRRSSTRT